MNLPRKQIQISNLFYTIPFATVFLLLLIILSVYNVFVFIPGLPVNIAYPSKIGAITNQNLPAAQTVILKSNGRIVLDRKEITETEFNERMKNLLKLPGAQQTFLVKAEPGVSSAAVKKIVDHLNSLNLKAQIAYDFPDLPVSNPFVGAGGFAIYALVDPNGLIYFENQVIEETQLRIKLSSIVQKAKEPLTLVIIADKSVPYEFIVKLGSIARSAGINRLLLATRPPTTPMFNE
ncbi:MAG: ExbD/TolR family protein [Verrucomicrobiia bacterium]